MERSQIDPPRQTPQEAAIDNLMVAFADLHDAAASRESLSDAACDVLHWLPRCGMGDICNECFDPLVRYFQDWHYVSEDAARFIPPIILEIRRQACKALGVEP